MAVHGCQFVLLLWYVWPSDAKGANARTLHMGVDPEHLKHYEARGGIPVYCKWIPTKDTNKHHAHALPQDAGPKLYSFRTFVAKIVQNLHTNAMKHVGHERMRRDSWWTWQEDNVRQQCDKTFCTPSTPMTGFEQVMTGSTLHLCYTIYHRKICQAQIKESRRGGSLSLRCFLHMAYRDELRLTNQAQSSYVSEIRSMRTNVKQKYEMKHAGCEPNEVYSNGFCDVGKQLEQHALNVMDSSMAKWNREECLEPRESPPLTHFHAFGPPEASPPWMQVDCEDNVVDNEMWVRLGARRQRVMYLQLWFMKFERDLYQGDDQWFFDALEATDETMYVRAMNLKNQRSQNFNSDKLPSVKPEFLHASPTKEEAKAARVLPTDLWQPLAVWNFVGIPKGSSSQSVDTISPDPVWEIPRPLMAHGIPEMKKFAPQKVPHPEFIGSTRFRKYLSAPEEWKHELWKQITPLQFDRYHAQELETKHFCTLVRLDPDFYRQPYFRPTGEAQTWNKKGAKQSWLESDFKTESANDANGCSIPLVHARIAALTSATDTASSEELTDADVLRTAYTRDDINVKKETEKPKDEHDDDIESPPPTKARADGLRASWCFLLLASSFA